VNHPEITIAWLRDSEGLFPHAIFFGDNDAVTAGWVSFTAQSRQEVVICKLTPREWNLGEAGIPSAHARIRANLSRSDLAYIRLVFAGERQPSAGVSFAEFRRTEPEASVYSGLRDGEQALLVRSESQQEFEGNGGKVTLVAA